MITRIKNLIRTNGKYRVTPSGRKPGDTAPDFSLVDSNGSQITLNELQGQPVVLVFYPADESPVCSDQLALYNESIHLFDEYGAQLLAISVDDLDSHKAFADHLKLKFPLLTDDNPTGGVADHYGVFDHNDGKSNRALFVINAEGVIHWSEVSPRPVNPGAHGILQALESIK